MRTLPPAQMKPAKIALLSLALAFTTAAFGAEAWTKNSLWKDRRAEVAIYNSEMTLSSTTYKFRETLIISKEEFRAGKGKPAAVFQMNQIGSFQTPNYPVNYLISIFVDQEEPDHVLKISASLQDWSGNTSNIFTVTDVNDRTGILERESHADGESRSSQSLNVQAKDYFTDQLPMSLRSLEFKAGTTAKIRLWPSLFAATAPVVALEPVEAVVEEVTEETIYSHAGAIPSVKVSVTYGGKSDFYWFEKAAPNVLVKMERSDGMKRLIYGRSRWSYWDRRIPRANILN